MIIEREHIGIFGKMNSGKSSIMNLITQQETSITDSTPGTTADIKIAMTEIHGLGPVKLFDTAGFDEINNLGEKKRKKVIGAIKECNLILLIIDPSTNDFETERILIEESRENDKQILILYNFFENIDESIIPKIETKIPILRFYQHMSLSAIENKYRMPLINFIIKNYETDSIITPLLPFIEKDEFYILNIPMDEETPGGRYLRPQLMAEEYITRNWAYPVSFRMNLNEARNKNFTNEKERFSNFLNDFKKRPKAIITDSQAIDIMSEWVPDDILLTTFSIMMINYGSNGKLNEFYQGIKALDTIQSGDKILIAEACNHSRIVEDIGTVQIPRIINEKYKGVNVEFNFGREFQENNKLSEYKLIIHCGGCMISHQKLQSRLRDLRIVGVPITNYGVFLSYSQGKEVLERVMKPWII
jgi:[FeFe] hydrogenase H-cluster maturation GTPase HydF